MGKGKRKRFDVYVIDFESRQLNQVIRCVPKKDLKEIAAMKGQPIIAIPTETPVSTWAEIPILEAKIAS